MFSSYFPSPSSRISSVSSLSPVCIRMMMVAFCLPATTLLLRLPQARQACVPAAARPGSSAVWNLTLCRGACWAPGDGRVWVDWTWRVSGWSGVTFSLKSCAHWDQHWVLKSHVKDFSHSDPIFILSFLICVLLYVLRFPLDSRFLPVFCRCFSASLSSLWLLWRLRRWFSTWVTECDRNFKWCY